MSIEKLTELTDSFASVVGGELLGRLPEAQRQAWVDTVFNPVTEQEAADILDGFGAFLLEEPLEGVEDTIKRNSGTEDETPLERNAAAERTRLINKEHVDTSVKQSDLLHLFSGDGTIQAKDATEAKCIGALIREDYLIASLYASICETDDDAGKYYLVEQQAIKLKTLMYGY